MIGNCRTLACSILGRCTLAEEEGLRAATLRTLKSYALFVTSVFVVVGFNAGFNAFSVDKSRLQIANC